MKYWRSLSSLCLLALIFGMLVCSTLATTPDSKECIDDKVCNTPYEHCKISEGKESGKCNHKNVFPIEAPEFVGAILLAIAISLCNAAGIGGGGIIVTIGLSLMMLSAKESVAMSNVAIFFGCVTRFIRNYNNKHPLKDATSIDYGIVTCMLPLVMLGTFVGVQINEFLPDFLVYILLFVTLCYLSYKAIVKSIETRRKETAALKKEKESDLQRSSSNAEARANGNAPTYEAKDASGETSGMEEKELFRPLNNTSNNTSGTKRLDSRQSIAKGPEISEYDDNVAEEDREVLAGERKSTYHFSEINEKLDKLLKAEKSHLRARNLVIVLVPFTSIFAITLLRGTPEFKSIVGIKRCDALDYILVAAQFLILIVLAVVNIILLKIEYQVKTENNYQFVKGDIVWDSKSITKFVIFAIIAGFISGAVGLSGGVLFTPLFLEFGIAPSVASGTSMYMAMFATLSSSILFMFSGFVVYQIAFWLSAFAIVGTAAGITVIGNAVKKSGRSSFLVILLAFVITLSAVTIAIEGTRNTIKDHNDGNPLMKFKEYC